MNKSKFKLLALFFVATTVHGCAAGARKPAGDTSTGAAPGLGSSLDLAVSEIQNYALNRNTPPVPPAVNLVGKSSYSFLRKGDPAELYLEVQSRNGATQEFSLGAVDIPPKIFTDLKNSFLAYLDRSKYPANVIVIDISSDIRTLSTPASGSDLILFKDHLLVVNGYSTTVQVSSFTYDDNGLTSLGATDLLTQAAGTGSFLVPEGDHLGIYVDQLNPIDGNPELVSIAVDEVGHKLKQSVSPQYYINPFEIDSDPNQSFARSGTLLPLYSNADVVALRSIYLSNPAGNITLLNGDGMYATWTNVGDILIERGSHARSTELTLLKAPDFKNEIRLSQPHGYKKNINVVGNEATYFNLQYVGPAALVSSDLTEKSYKLLARNTPKLINAKIPEISEVDYPSGNRRVPSMLSVPAGVRNNQLGGKKLPAIVYIHGGYESEPGHGELMVQDTDPIVLSQLGYVVVDANWFGNAYLSRKYKTWTHRLFQLEKFTPQLEDIQAAGEYAKSLPFVDPNKIILMGFSYGSVLSSLYLTSADYKGKSPFAAAVLKSGFYTKEWLSSAGLRVFTSPRLAVGPTDENRSIFPQYAASSGHLVFTPSTPINDVTVALTQLNSLNSPTPRYYGVLYSLPDSFYDETLALQRIKDLHKIPIFITQGTGDNVSESQAFAAACSPFSNQLSTWYPDTSDHYFKGSIQQELVDKIENFVNQITSVTK
jgi:dienelactone hydrolase